LGLNDFSGYTAPINIDHLGPNFMFYGYTPAHLMDPGSEQGIQVCSA